MAALAFAVAVVLIFFSLVVSYSINKSREEMLNNVGMGVAQDPLPETSPSDFATLKECRDKTTRHLKTARTFLPPVPQETSLPAPGRLTRFDEYLNRNELGLALDEMESLGELNACPSGFWRELATAADTVGLPQKADHFWQHAKRAR